MSGLLNALIPIGLIAVAAYVFVNRCSPQFEKLGLCQALEGGGSGGGEESAEVGGGGGGTEASEPTAGAPSEGGGGGGGSGGEPAPKKSSSSKKKSTGKKSSAKAPSVGDINKMVKDMNKGVVPKVSGGGSGGGGNSCGCKCKMINGAARCTLNNYKTTFGYESYKKSVSKSLDKCIRSKCGTANYAHSYFTSPHDVRPYRTFRGRLSL